jgi:ribosomal protein RSM22 (predicted rRNA methylase)
MTEKKGIGQGGIWLNARVQNPPTKKEKRKKTWMKKRGENKNFKKRKRKNQKRGSISFTTARLTIFSCFSGLVCIHTATIAQSFAAQKCIFLFFETIDHVRTYHSAFLYIHFFWFPLWAV